MTYAEKHIAEYCRHRGIYPCDEFPAHWLRDYADSDSFVIDAERADYFGIDHNGESIAWGVALHDGDVSRFVEYAERHRLKVDRRRAGSWHDRRLQQVVLIRRFPLRVPD